MDHCLDRRPRPSSHPSFSATLLDAIYQSLDGAMPEIENSVTKQPKPQPDRPLQKKKSQSDFWWASAKRKQAPRSYTSSDSSSYGFSSDAETSRAKPGKENRAQFNPPALPPKTPPQEKKKKSNPFRTRWRELRKGHACASATSTGTCAGSGKRGSSPLSNFLKAIFSSTRTAKKKNTILVMAAAQQEGVGNAVPVEVPVPASPPTKRGDDDIDTETVKRKVEEILRGLEKEGEVEEEEEGSDASSDLFELENLAEIGAAELPVYCTTSIVANHPTVVAHN